MKRLALLVLMLAAVNTTRPGPVSDHGALHVDGCRILGADGRPVSLAGNSFFWSQWMGRFYDGGVVEWLRRDWKVSVVRAAMGVESGGYLAHPGVEQARVCAVVDAAIAADIYVIIDWHDHHAHQHTEQAVTFFREMARRYGGRPNVMYEIFNEPTSEVTWAGDVKPYAEKVVAAIRSVDPVNLIIVGSPHWSQDADVAAGDPISAPGLAYALHFYAGTHKQWLRDKAVAAMKKGAPLFVTEWGTCNADGNGPVDAAETERWMAFMREWQLSHCNWAVSDKAETASILAPGASSTGGWRESDLTESGRLVRRWTRAWAENPPGKG